MLSGQGTGQGHDQTQGCVSRLPLALSQVRSISTSFVVVGEDLASHAHPLVWHQRNFDHHPGFQLAAVSFGGSDAELGISV